ncbi:MAG TPA: YDG domain-containing protein, partial [Candidatus Acidoferrum sp.]|nr:YDG domain-containing protein [Candidatus Acidoferrum sp.]
MRRTTKAVFVAVLILAAGIIVKGSITQPSIGGWLSAASMTGARSNAASALLQDGRILITGGDNGVAPVASAEFFDTTGAFVAAPPMSMARSAHSATVLGDGRILVAGGSIGAAATNSAEIFDPAANAWTPVAGGMIQARSNHTASLLSDGRVLFAGGDNAGTATASLEIFDPVANSFSSAGVMSAPRMSFASAVLSDGRVILIGGSNGSVPIASTEIFDPTSNSVAAGPALSAPRMAHSATTLLDGRVLVAGGANVVTNADGSSTPTDLASAEIYEPATGNFAVSTSSLAAPRRDHLAFLLPNNNSVLMVGGTSSSNEVATAEMFVPSTGTFTATGSPAAARQHATGTALKQDGILFLAGGSNSTGTLSSAELYGFATVKTDKADYAPGSVVTITGSGWQPGETVTLTLVESPLVDTHPVMTSVADSTGRIVNTDFSPDVHDISIRFYLTAVGSVSGRQAQNTFTDGKVMSVSVATPPASVTIAPGGTAAFGLITANFNGTFNTSNPSCTATLNTTALPSGASPLFGTNPLTATSNTNLTSSFSVTTTAATPAGSTVFQVTATNGAGCQDASTNQSNSLTLVVVAKRIGTVTVGAQTGALTFGTPGSATYAVTVVRNGATGAAFSAGLTLTTSLPTGASASFSPSTISFAAGDTSKTSTLTITDTAATPASSTVFTVQATNPSVSGDSSTANGTVTVDKATPTITWSNPADIVYGTALSGTQLNATASVPGTLAYNPASGIVLAAGSNQNLNVDFTPTDTANFNNASKDVKINVNPKQVTPTIAASDKAYDGNTTASITTCTVAVKVGSDDVACSVPVGNATFASANASGSPQTVTATGITLTGTTAGNYTLGANTTATTTAKINAKSVTAAITADDKDYDATTAATIHCTLSGVLAAEAANVTCSGTGSFADANAGPGKTVTSNNLTLGGTASGNYILSSTTATASATIRKKSVTAAITADDKDYDATTAATIHCTLSGVLAAEAANVTCSGTGSFADANAGPGKTVTSNNLTLGGTASGNYILSSTTATASATIRKKSVTAAITADDKDYDATTAATIHCTLSGVLAAETANVTCSGTGSFADANAGPGKTVTSNNLTLGGPASGNYILSTTTATASATIRKKSVTPAVTADNKDYDGTTSATTDCTLTGVLTGDSASVICSGTGNFADANAGPGKTVTSNNLTLSGTASGNYILSTTTAATSATINKIDATVSVTGYNVPYDGTQHTASATATGLGGASVGSFILTGTQHTDAGIYNADAWSFSGGTNYNDKNGSVDDKINKIDATVSVTAYNVPYDGAQHTASATATGLGGASVGSFILTGTQHTDAGIYNADA